jgi:hypothetical protein
MWLGAALEQNNKTKTSQTKPLFCPNARMHLSGTKV